MLGPLVPNVNDPGLSIDVIAFHIPIHHTHLRIVSHEDRPVPLSTRCCTSPVPSQGTRISTYPPMISRHSFSSQVAKGAERTTKKNQSSLPANFFTQNMRSIYGVVVFGDPCPDAAHENPPPVTYVPSPSRFAGSPSASQPPPEKAASGNFKVQPSPLIPARR
jgi:hypothetical protein